VLLLAIGTRTYESNVNHANVTGAYRYFSLNTVKDFNNFMRVFFKALSPYRISVNGSSVALSPDVCTDTMLVLWMAGN
jgi:hypothetical protein